MKGTSHTTNKFCCCGNPATTKKNFGAVCDRCDRIEKSLTKQLMDSKTKSGIEGAVDYYEVHLPRIK